jgi:hypothetical protein
MFPRVFPLRYYCELFSKMLEEAFRQFVVLLLKFKNKFSTNFTFVNLQAFSFVSQIIFNSFDVATTR